VVGEGERRGDWGRSGNDGVLSPGMASADIAMKISRDVQAAGRDRCGRRRETEWAAEGRSCSGEGVHPAMSLAAISMDAGPDAAAVAGEP
jgi:hypothetical protein